MKREPEPLRIVYRPGPAPEDAAARKARAIKALIRLALAQERAAEAARYNPDAA